MLKEIYFKSKSLIKRYYNILALPAFLLMMLNAVTVTSLDKGTQPFVVCDG